MFLRTVLVTAVAAGAITTGFAITAQEDTRDKAPHVGLSDAQTVRVSQVSPAQPGELLPAKPPQLAPAKPSPSQPIQLSEITPAQAEAQRSMVLTPWTGGLEPVVTQHTPEGHCTVSGGNTFLDHPYNFNASVMAWYRTVPNASGLYEWFQFAYKLDGLGVGTGNHSNARLRMYEADTQKFQHTSQDDRRLGTWYYLMPTSPIYTGSTSSVSLDLDATFDRSGRPDPTCTARTGRL